MLFSIGVYAQSADVITQILETDKVTYGQMCYLSAVRQNLIFEDDSFDTAVAVMAANYQVEELLDVDYIVNAETVAAMFMRIWPNVKGGLFFRITNGSPRYAYKHLKAVRIIPENIDPKSSLTGAQALNILTLCMNKFGADDECMALEVEDEVEEEAEVPVEENASSEVVEDQSVKTEKTE